MTFHLFPKKHTMTKFTLTQSERNDLAKLSLLGLCVGDCFGQRLVAGVERVRE